MLKFRPKEEQLRLIFTSKPHSSMPESEVTAIIGPFKDFTDKAELQDMLETLLRGYNVTSKP